jgi:hypothetical protein
VKTTGETSEMKVLRTSGAEDPSTKRRNLRGAARKTVEVCSEPSRRDADAHRTQPAPHMKV